VTGAREASPNVADPTEEPVLWGAIAELLASFGFVFVAAGSVVMAGTGGDGLVGVAIASGAGYAAALAVSARRSGGGANPVLTAAFWVAGRLSAPRAAAYAAAQVGGGIVAGLLLRVCIPSATWHAAALGAPLLAQDVGSGRAVLIEAVLAFVLTIAAFATLVDERREFSVSGANAVGPASLVLGLVVAGGTLVAWPLTGAALNPARALGPELAAGEWLDWWVFWVGPLAGGVVGSVAYWFLFLSADEPRDGDA
jgi:glycerol uptake facilitator-like aquaporin